jgi:pyruvate dehydrogenase E2 component (dihydrolipoamide acetyltransferase)
MAEAILMPRLSDTMTEGVIAAWHKNVGDTVKKGDLLAEVETDKATMELESYQDGVLLYIGTPNGGKLQVNDLLAIFGKAGEDVSALVAEHQPAPLSPLPLQHRLPKRKQKKNPNRKRNPSLHRKRKQKPPEPLPWMFLKWKK